MRQNPHLPPSPLPPSNPRHTIASPPKNSPARRPWAMQSTRAFTDSPLPLPVGRASRPSLPASLPLPLAERVPNTSPPRERGGHLPHQPSEANSSPLSRAPRERPGVRAPDLLPLPTGERAGERGRLSPPPSPTGEVVAKQPEGANQVFIFPSTQQKTPARGQGCDFMKWVWGASPGVLYQPPPRLPPRPPPPPPP